MEIFILTCITAAVIGSSHAIQVLEECKEDCEGNNSSPICGFRGDLTLTFPSQCSMNYFNCRQRRRGWQQYEKMHDGECQRKASRRLSVNQSQNQTQVLQGQRQITQLHSPQRVKFSPPNETQEPMPLQVPYVWQEPVHQPALNLPLMDSQQQQYPQQVPHFPQIDAQPQLHPQPVPYLPQEPYAQAYPTPELYSSPQWLYPPLGLVSPQGHYYRQGQNPPHEPQPPQYPPQVQYMTRPQ